MRQNRTSELINRLVVETASYRHPHEGKSWHITGSQLPIQHHGGPAAVKSVSINPTGGKRPEQRGKGFYTTSRVDSAERYSLDRSHLNSLKGDFAKSGVVTSFKADPSAHVLKIPYNPKHADPELVNSVAKHAGVSVSHLLQHHGAVGETCGEDCEDERKTHTTWDRAAHSYGKSNGYHATMFHNHKDSYSVADDGKYDEVVWHGPEKIKYSSHRTYPSKTAKKNESVSDVIRRLTESAAAAQPDTPALRVVPDGAFKTHVTCNGCHRSQEFARTDDYHVACIHCGHSRSWADRSKGKTLADIGLLGVYESHQCPDCGYSGDSKKSAHEFDGWRKPTESEAHTEYDRENPKVEPRLGKLWKDKHHFAADVEKSPVEEIPDHVHKRMDYASHHDTIDDLKDLTSTYRRPRDVDSITRGYHEHASMPAPIVLKHTLSGPEKPRYRVMAGNTRLAAAEVHGVPRKAVVVDVTDHLRKSGGRF